MGLKGFEKLDMKGARVLSIRLPARVVIGSSPGRHTIALPGWRPPTLNQLMRGRLRDRMRLGREAREAIDFGWRFASIPPAAGRRRVSLEIALKGRQRPCDVDAPWKAVLDGLKSCGAILDDSPEHCELGTLAFTRGGQTCTTIILEDL